MVEWKVFNNKILEENIDSRLIPLNSTTVDTTIEFKTVDKISLSPNFWDKEVGNAHYFFHVVGLEWDKGRPIKFLHNELLHPELRSMRRVLQSVGDEALITKNPEPNVWLGFDTNVEKTINIKVTDRAGKTKLYSVKVTK